MTYPTLHRPPQQTTTLIRPEPRESVVGGNVRIRPARERGADLSFVDALQKKHSAMVGFLSSEVFKAGMARGHLLIAEDAATTARLGYCLFNDKYFKREDTGIVYQLNVLPDKQRGLLGAMLVKAAFEHSAEGVTLFCCWCAQYLEANHFWEAMGFVPLAFRAGSRGKAQGGKRKEGRIQIMWQRRIREGDAATPYWYPTETTGGAMKENRIALPIPPGAHWSEAMPMVLPTSPEEEQQRSDACAALPEGGGAVDGKRKRRGAAKRKDARSQETMPNVVATNGLRFGDAAEPCAMEDAVNATKAKEKASKPRRRNNADHLKLARKFRHQYLEEVNSGRLLLSNEGKYEVSRQLGCDAAPSAVEQPRLLNAA